MAAFLPKSIVTRLRPGHGNHGPPAASRAGAMMGAHRAAADQEGHAVPDAVDVDLDAIAAAVRPLVARAGVIALRSFRATVAVDDKGGRHGFDPVTEADRAIEAFLRDELSQRYPDHQIVGEEQGTSGPAGRARWLIDPIDGTKAFVTGVPAWGILLGLVVDDRPVAGWAHQPYLGETFEAVGGVGTLDHDGRRRPLGTSSTTDLAAATLYSTHPSMFESPPDHAAYDRLSRIVRLQRFGGDCYSYCLLALGHIDLVVESGLQAYDIVPLIPIVEAAGGLVTDRDGRPPVDGGFVVAAATAELHARALDVLQARA
jgi:myo-inositol-1(or 4)-monophosphatase